MANAEVSACSFNKSRAKASLINRPLWLVCSDIIVRHVQWALLLAYVMGVVAAYW